MFLQIRKYFLLWIVLWKKFKQARHSKIVRIFNHNLKIIKYLSFPYQSSLYLLLWSIIIPLLPTTPTTLIIFQLYQYLKQKRLLRKVQEVFRINEIAVQSKMKENQIYLRCYSQKEMIISSRITLNHLFHHLSLQISPKGKQEKYIFIYLFKFFFT